MGITTLLFKAGGPEVTCFSCHRPKYLRPREWRSRILPLAGKDHKHWVNSTNDYPSSPSLPLSSFVIYLFITYLAAPGLSSSMWIFNLHLHAELVATSDIKVPWPGIKLGAPWIGSVSLKPWTTREVPFFLSKWDNIFTLDLIDGLLDACEIISDNQYQIIKIRVYKKEDKVSKR